MWVSAQPELPNHESRTRGGWRELPQQGVTWGPQDGQAGRTLGGWQDTWGKSKAMSPLLRCSSQTRWGRTNRGFFSLGLSRILWHRQLKPSSEERGYFKHLSVFSAAEQDSPMPQTSFLPLHLLSFPRGRVMAGDSQDSPVSPFPFLHICAQPGIICFEILVLKSDTSEVTWCRKHFGVAWGTAARS